MPPAGLYVTHAVIAAVLDCSESVLRAARNLTRAKLASRLKRRGPGHRATLYALEDVIAWARAHAHLTDSQEAALREHARPYDNANEGPSHV